MKTKTYTALYAYGANGVVRMFRGLLVIPFLFQNLGIEAYGTYVLVMSGIGYAVVVCSFGQEYALLRYLPSLIRTNEGKRLFNSMMQGMALWLAICALIAAGVAWTVFPNDTVQKLVALGAVSTAGITLFTLAAAYYRCESRVESYLWALSLFQVGQTIVVITLAIIFKNVVVVIAGDAAFSLAAALIMAVYQLRRCGIARGEWKSLVLSVRFGAHVVVTQLTSTASRVFDKYLIASFAGVAAVAYYAPAFALAAILLQVSAIASMPLPANLSLHHGRDDRAGQISFARQTLDLYGSTAIPAAIGLMAIAPSVLAFMTSPDIVAQAYPVAVALAIGMLVNGYGVMFIHILRVHGQASRVSATSFVSLVLFIAAGSGAILLGVTAPLALAISYLGVAILQTGLFWFWASKLLRGVMYLFFHFKVICASFLMLAPLPWLHFRNIADVGGYVLFAMIAYFIGLRVIVRYSLRDMLAALSDVKV